jgi:Ca2+-binding RTX toxin-like protein
MVPSDPHVILDGTTNPASLLYRIADPEAQTGGAEFGGGSIKRVGDITGGANATCGLTGTGNNCPDGIPEFEIAARNLDYPLKTPDASFIDAGAGFLFNGKTGLPLRTFTDPEPQPRAQFSGTFNPGRAVGDIGATSLPDVLEPAALQNAFSTDDGKAWGMNGDPNAGGGGEQSFNFATITDPFPKVGGNFGGAFTGVGNLVSGPDAPTNEVLVGGIQFDPATEASNSNIGQVHFMNVTTGKDLQDITDPDQQAGSGFGVGITPMGDLNGDGFLDFAVSAYLENLTFAAQGRAFIFTSNNAPPASQPATATSATVVGAATTISTASSGKCLNKITGSNRDDHLNGTSNGDVIFGLGGKDVINGFGGDDCLDGGSGNDRIAGGNGSDKLVGGTGADRLAGNDGDDQLFGSNGSDALDGGSGADLLAGGAGNDTLRGGAGDDTIYGEAGNDRIFAGGGNNFIDGGKGDDRIDARNGKRDTIICGPGHDSVQADRVDRVNGCERVKRPAKAKRASARRGVR